MNRETRTLTAPEIRFAEGDEGRFNGYASVFGEPDSYGDTIKPGAFRKSLGKRSGPVAMFLNHNPEEPVGIWDELVEDARGLKVSGRIADTTKGRDVLTLLKMKSLTGLSIGFRARSAERGPNGGRVLTEIDLVEISLVSLPAASKARVVSVKNSAVELAGIAAFLAACRTASHSMRK